MGRGVKTKVEQCAFRRIFFLVRAGVFIERAPAIIAIVELCCVHPVCIPHCQSYLDAFADRFRIYQSLKVCSVDALPLNRLHERCTISLPVLNLNLRCLPRCESCD